MYSAASSLKPVVQGRLFSPPCTPAPWLNCKCPKALHFEVGLANPTKKCSSAISEMSFILLNKNVWQKWRHCLSGFRATRWTVKFYSSRKACILDCTNISSQKQVSLILNWKGKKIVGSTITEHLLGTKHAARYNKQGIHSFFHLRNVAGGAFTSPGHILYKSNRLT